MIARRGVLAVLLLVAPCTLAAQATATIDGEDTSWCTSPKTLECTVETYGPNVDLFGREDDAQELIDERQLQAARPARP